MLSMQIFLRQETFSVEYAEHDVPEVSKLQLLLVVLQLFEAINSFENLI